MRKYLTGLIITSLGLVLANQALAADTASVTATVTVENISVSVSDGSIAYGTLSVSTSQDTTNSGVNDTQTATNDGNVTATLNIRGSDTTNWILAGTAGADQYVHKFCTSDCDTSPTWTALTTTNQTLATPVAASGTQDFDLQITTPTSSSNYTEQSVDVTVQATSP